MNWQKHFETKKRNKGKTIFEIVKEKIAQDKTNAIDRQTMIRKGWWKFEDKS